MKTLAAIYCADGEGHLIDPSTGKCWRNAYDREAFRKKVRRAVLIMGRKTWDTDGKALRETLPECKFVILTHGVPARVLVDYDLAYMRYVSDITEALFVADHQWGERDAWVIGGYDVLAQFMPFVSCVFASSPSEEIYLNWDSVNEETWSVAQEKRPPEAYRCVVALRNEPIFFHEKYKKGVDTRKTIM